ncbi:MAG: dihydropteroate synthase-like protein [Sulfolobales archaeon]
MKILVVTSVSAYDLAKEIVNNIKDHEVDICKLDYPVASLMTTSYIAKELSNKISKEYDYVIIPGLAIGDASIVRNVVKTEVIKGPKYLGDLPDVIKFIESGVKFSTKLPADDIIRDYIATKYGVESRRLLEVKEGIDLNGLRIPLRPPPIILVYEVMMREDSDYLKVLERISRALGQGADLIVIGLPVEHKVSVNTLKKLLNDIKSELHIPIGIDVQTPDVFNYLEAGPDLIMNVDMNNINLLSNFKDKGVVIIPTATTPTGFIKSLKKSVEEAIKLGFSKVIIDPLLKPLQLGFVESLVNYYIASKEFNYPLMMGFSNIYELIDADTHSTIALLTSIAMEIGVSMVLITEESRKSLNSLNEAVKAREMIYRAYIRKSPPIDVGIDLLIVKEKKSKSVKAPEINVETHVVPKESLSRINDEVYFKIYVDELRKTIVVDVHTTRNGECVKRYIGNDAPSLWRIITKDYPTLSKDHYSYLGYELCKAETALKLGRSYLQDYPLFS